MVSLTGQPILMYVDTLQSLLNIGAERENSLLCVIFCLRGYQMRYVPKCGCSCLDTIPSIQPVTKGERLMMRKGVCECQNLHICAFILKGEHHYDWQVAYNMHHGYCSQICNLDTVKC